MTVRIVTDSTADIPLAEAESLGITMVPLTVFFGEDAYLDGVELDNEGFYQKLQTSKDLPRTSQPSPAAFQEAFTRLISDGATGILSIHLSSKLSGTYQAACTARDTLPDELKTIPIEIIDSENVSAAMAPTIQQAAQKARDGWSMEQLRSFIVDELARTRLLIVLDNLDYIKRGGRIGGARALLGNMLSVKPILTLKEGAVVPVEQPRTRNRAYTRIAQLAAEMGKAERMCIAESNSEVGNQLAEAIKVIHQGEITHYKLGAVLGTHTGPGAVALVVTKAK